ncbi:hypothetical protein O181_013899 [Austropuccinia psidii MF-1]|uniref:Retrotransposon gag domain-containing protein n=1 Tax=Austropuccinia psidii MF-1 TaxID=1389203 RepID=A0A9Q3BZ62_9BASI|nr:hypothetical protein [Austropuccinia psidii MF-1]
MQKMTQIMANLQEALSYESSRPPAFKNPSLKAPNSLIGLSPSKKKILYATSFLIGRASKCIELYLSNLTNQVASYLLNSWHLFKDQILTLFGDQNEVRNAEAGLIALRMNKGGHVSLYIADFRSLVSRIGDWGERALIHHFRKGLQSRILDQLASNSSRIDCPQDLVDITLELDTRYHERHKENSHHQEKKPEASSSNACQPQNSLISSQKKKNNFRRRISPILLY